MPSPGYSPFTGGFTFSVNLSAPITEIKSKQLSKQKIQSIQNINALTALALKNEVAANYKAVEIEIYEFHAKDTLDYLTLQAFDLSKSQYQRNQITPTEFFAAQKNFQSWKVQRTVETDAINISILQLFIKSKAAITTNDYGFKNLMNNDKTTTIKSNDGTTNR